MREGASMQCMNCQDVIDPTDEEALEQNLCRTCLERAMDGMGYPELED